MRKIPYRPPKKVHPSREPAELRALREKRQVDLEHLKKVFENEDVVEHAVQMACNDIIQRTGWNHMENFPEMARRFALSPEYAKGIDVILEQIKPYIGRKGVTNAEAELWINLQSMIARQILYHLGYGNAEAHQEMLAIRARMANLIQKNDPRILGPMKRVVKTAKPFLKTPATPEEIAYWKKLHSKKKS